MNSGDSIDSVGIIGYGEAGQLLSNRLLNNGLTVTVINRSPSELRDELGNGPLAVASSIPELAETNMLVISTVWPETAVEVARLAARAMTKESYYLDLNSVSSLTTKRIGDMVTESGAGYLKGAILGSVSRQGESVPLGISGDNHEQLAAFLRGMGLNVQSLGEDIRKPAVIRMSRSLFTKGLINLFAESLVMAHIYDVQEETLDSIAASFEDFTIDEWARYFLVDTLQHAERRIGELDEVENTATDTGITLPVVEVTRRLHESIAETDPEAETYDEVLGAIHRHYERAESQ